MKSFTAVLLLQAACAFAIRLDVIGSRAPVINETVQECPPGTVDCGLKTVDALAQHYSELQINVGEGSGRPGMPSYGELEIIIELGLFMSTPNDLMRIVHEADSIGYTGSGEFLDAGQSLHTGSRLQLSAHLYPNFIVEIPMTLNGDATITDVMARFRTEYYDLLMTGNLREGMATGPGKGPGKGPGIFTSTGSKTVAALVQHYDQFQIIIELALYICTPDDLVAIVHQAEFSGYNGIDFYELLYEGRSLNYGDLKDYGVVPGSRLQLSDPQNLSPSFIVEIPMTLNGDATVFDLVWGFQNEYYNLFMNGNLRQAKNRPTSGLAGKGKGYGTPGLPCMSGPGGM
jgi:hypothetical protein